MKRLIKLFLLSLVLCSCETPYERYYSKALDPEVLIGQWYRIHDSSSIVTITDEYIDFYSDGQYVCKYSCVDYSSRFFTLRIDCLWLDNNVCNIFSSMSPNDSTLYLRWYEPILPGESTFSSNSVVLIKK